MSPESRTRFLFDIPVYKDWMFYIFLLFLIVNVSSGLSNVADSGGITTSGTGLISGTFDGAFRVLFSWVEITPIYFIRKLVRKRRLVQHD
jgi:hypothetical protein